MRYTVSDFLAALSEVKRCDDLIATIQEVRQLEQGLDIAEDWFREAQRTTISIRWMYEEERKRAKAKYKMIAAARAREYIE